MTPIQNKVDNLGSIINSQQATLTSQQSAIDGIDFNENQLTKLLIILFR